MEKWLVVVDGAVRGGTGWYGVLRKPPTHSRSPELLLAQPPAPLLRRFLLLVLHLLRLHRRCRRAILISQSLQLLHQIMVRDRRRRRARLPGCSRPLAARRGGRRRRTRTHRRTVCVVSRRRATPRLVLDGAPAPLLRRRARPLGAVTPRAGYAIAGLRGRRARRARCGGG